MASAATDPKDVDRADRTGRRLLLALLFVIATASLARADDERPPDLVVVLVDDLGWQDTEVAFHPERSAGQRRFRTPHVAALAARGLVLEHGYASAPVCTPTRTSLLTGRTPGQNHITYWTLHADRDTSRPWKGLRPPAWNVNGLQPGDVTLPALLAEADYRTIHVGKAHLGAVDTPGSDPTTLGYEVAVAGHGAGAPGSYLADRGFRKDPTKDSVWDVPGLEGVAREGEFLTETLARRACEELRATPADRPLFLHFAPYAVHTPLEANERWREDFEGLDPREVAYATMVRSVDAALGELVATLEDLGRLANTWIVFTSDNGGLSAHARGGEPHVHNQPLRSGKGSAYEGGLRVPWIVAGPGVAHGRSDAVTVTHDLFPTLLALAGVAIPAAHAPTVEGLDQSAHWRGDEAPDERSLPRSVHWHQPHFWGVDGPGIQPFSAVRRGPHKLLWWHATGTFELYDVVADPGERHDLAAARPELLRDLALDLARWMDARDVQPSVDEATGEQLGPPGSAR